MRVSPFRSSVFRSPSCAHYLEEGDYILYWLAPFSPRGRSQGEGDPIGVIVEWYPLRGARILPLHVSEDSSDVTVESSDGKEVLGYVAVDSGVIALVPPRYLGEEDRASAALKTLTTLSKPGWVFYSDKDGWMIVDHALDIIGNGNALKGKKKGFLWKNLA